MKLSPGQKRVLEVIKKNSPIGRQEAAEKASVSYKNFNKNYIVPLGDLVSKTRIESELRYVITKKGKKSKIEAPEVKAKPKEERFLGQPAPKAKPKAKKKPKEEPKPKPKKEPRARAITKQKMDGYTPEQYEKAFTIEDAIKQLTVYIEALAAGHQKWKNYGFSSVTEMKGSIYGLINIIIRKSSRGE